MPKSLIGRHGFTLLELLMALSIGSIVLTAVYGTFHTAIKAKTRAEAAMTPLRTARYFFCALKTDIQHIPVNTKAASLDCKKDRCAFPIYKENASTDGTVVPDDPVVTVCYSINRKKELIRQIMPLNESGKIPAWAGAEPGQEILGHDIRRLGFDLQTKQIQNAQATAALMIITIAFESKPEPVQYHYAMLVEQTLQP